MKMTFALIAPALLLSACAATPLQTASVADSGAPTPVAPGGAVSSADPRATAAGEEILAKGGSATDAAIAVMIALTVVEPQSSGIGGGGFYVHADGESKLVSTIDGRETAPAAATPNRFLGSDGKPLSREQRVLSGLSVGVPGNIALAAKAHAAHGKLRWDELFEPAIRLARDGFTMNVRLHQSLSSSRGRADKTEAAKAIFFGSDGEPLPVGATVRNPAFANTLQYIAEGGPDAFYQSGAASLATYVASETPQDGKMTAEDITSYQAKDRPPVCSSYRSYKICGMGPPSSGGVAVSQMLGQLERFDLSAMGPDSSTFWHLFLESQRIAYADREIYLADSDFVSVPVEGLIDPDYIASRSALIREDSALTEVSEGIPEGATIAWADGNEPPENGTTHFSVADASGNIVSWTSTIEGAFGSGLFYGGFYLNNELTDFSTDPQVDGKPVANRVEGGKRPRSSMAPTIVFDEDGKVVLVIGAAGGATIPVQTARSIIGVIDFGLSANEAIALPLLMTFGSRVISEEGSIIGNMVAELEALGHNSVRLIPPRGKTNALRALEGGGWEVGTDPRVDELLVYER